MTNSEGLTEIATGLELASVAAHLKKKKLTRAEACAELARRIWPDAAIKNPYPKNVFVVTDDDAFDFNPFASRDDAAGLVAWLKSGDPDTWLNFLWRLIALIVGVEYTPAIEERNFEAYWIGDAGGLLLLTPEQIALAVCAALGIEVE